MKKYYLSFLGIVACGLLIYAGSFFAKNADNAPKPKFLFTFQGKEIVFDTLAASKDINGCFDLLAAGKWIATECGSNFLVTSN